jgi:urea transport system substrate-binding protein
MKIGLIASRQGPAGLWAFAVDSCAMLAAAELNAAGGVLGRQVELVIADAGMMERDARAGAADLVDLDGVDAIIGMHASHLRHSVATAIGGRVPYVYAPMYEGGEQDGNVLPIGGTDIELLGHSIPALMERRRAARFFLLGNDYVWPRSAINIAHRVVARAGGRVVGQNLAGFGTDYESVLPAIRRSGADVVVTFLLGEETIRFNRAFAAAGLSARCLRLAFAVDETVLYGGGADVHDNLYVGTTYIAAAGTRRSEHFLELYRSHYGSMVPPATVFGQCCYDSVHLLAGLAHSEHRGGKVGFRCSFSRLARARPSRRALPSGLMAAGNEVHLAEVRGIEFKVVSTRQMA